MRISIIILLSCSLLLLGCSEESVRRTMRTVNESINKNQGSLTANEVAAGLKEALVIGANEAVDFAGNENAFLQTPRLRIPFPEEAERVKDTAEKLGLDRQVEIFEENLNHAAEKAVAEAFPIFVDAIASMTIEDAFSILNGGENAATRFLRNKTETSLESAFRPKVKTAIDQVELTKYWSPLISAYNTSNMLTGGEDVDPDLTGYVTERAMDGLFLLISEEEEKIRKDPLARTTELLERVFGSKD